MLITKKSLLLMQIQGQFSSDGQKVVLHEAGIQQASCDCSAAGCCKHILAAILWLQANNNSD